MAISVKVIDRPIPQTSYVRATISGMALTLKHLLDRTLEHFDADRHQSAPPSLVAVVSRAGRSYRA